ncbi:hypothetical protein ASF44_18855 [Pseudorhodoferax sp. Leaf274]|nr:hypothetical protein ASF44_18855 [Pseudorhodoferax sp. Leaf274]
MVLAVATLGHVLFTAPLAATACGVWPPKHGGQMNYEGGEVAVELVGHGRQVSLYLEDHGVPIPAGQVKGTLAVKRGATGWTAPVKAAGDNRVTVQLPRALAKGDEIVADLAFANGSITQGRFVYGEEVQMRTQFGAGRANALPGFAPRPATMSQ